MVDAGVISNDVSTHSRPKAAAIIKICSIYAT